MLMWVQSGRAGTKPARRSRPRREGGVGYRQGEPACDVGDVVLAVGEEPHECASLKWPHLEA